MRNKLTKLAIEQIIKLHENGNTCREISRKLDVHHKTVSCYLKRHGFTPNRTGPVKPKYLSNDTIICSKCGTEQAEDNFRICRSNGKYPYRLSYCNCCRSKQINQNYNKNKFKILKDIFNRTKIRCKDKNIFFDISYEYLLDIFSKQKETCFYSGTVLEFARGNGTNWNSCTLDRIVPEKGYVEGNIVLCTRRFNTVKNDLSLEEIKFHMPKWYDKFIFTPWIKI